jgi:hypothetical protein
VLNKFCGTFVCSVQREVHAVRFVPNTISSMQNKEIGQTRGRNGKILYNILAQIYTRSNEYFLDATQSIMEKFTIRHHAFEISVMNL